MERFKVLNHTADIGLQAYGRTLKEAFENTALGMFSLITDLDKVAEGDCLDVKVEAEDRETLLVEWLNELIYLFEVQEVLLKKFDIVDWDEEHHLTALVCGEKIDLERHPIKIQVKACTYHLLKVSKDDLWVAQVIFDV